VEKRSKINCIDQENFKERWEIFRYSTKITNYHIR
jgi:hypothetical protein